MRKQTKRAKTTKVQPQQRNAFNLLEVHPKTDGQREMVFSYLNDNHVIAAGSAGTGKTYMACWLALKDILEKEKDRIVIVRSTVPTRDQGFLPGTVEEKSQVYQAPYQFIINELCQRGDAYDVLKKKDQIQFLTTSFVRGITIDNAVIIIDEFQSMTRHELFSVLTRVGENTQVIICGDTKQNDLKKEQSCFSWLMNLSEKLDDWFVTIHFTHNDIVRSEFVRDLIIADEKLG